jgi:hypothetical protein
MQVCFEATSKDGRQIYYYVVAFTPNAQPAAISSFVVQIPVAETGAEKYADEHHRTDQPDEQS